MIRLGRTWSNLMVDVVATNAKLRGRVLRILREASGADEAQARDALEQAGGELKPALLSMLAGVSAAAAREAIEQHHGSVAHALQALQAEQTPQTAPASQPPSLPGRSGHPDPSDRPLPEDSPLSTTVTTVPTGEPA